MRSSKSKIKSLTKLGILFGVRESYLFARNLYGLYSHPFLTIKRIIIEKDLFQAVLIFGLPIYLWLGWVVVLLISRIFIFGELKFGYLAKTSFLMVSFSVSLLFFFISYCLWSYFSKTKHKVI